MMYYSIIRRLVTLLILLLISISAHALPIVYLDKSDQPVVIDCPSAIDVQSALRALGTEPTTALDVLGLSTAVPVGTELLDFRVENKGAVVNFSKKLLANGTSDANLEDIFNQVKWTVWNYLGDVDVYIQVDGTPLSSHAQPSPKVKAAKKNSPEVSPTGALSGHSITLSPGHGLVWTGTMWSTQRPVYCAPLSEEDYHNVDLCQYLDTYLKNDGMTVKLVRCTDKNYGNHYTGNPWWKMASTYWLKHAGYPTSVYASSTNELVQGSGSRESSDDIRARPLASNLDNTDIYISIHTNGLRGDCAGADCPNGTCTYYDAGDAHAEWGDVSKNLSDSIQSGMIDVIKNRIPISDWRDRGSMNSDGNYGEIRIPERPAALVELAFHDTCNRDAALLRDNFFRSATMWGIYKGVCDYFGKTPTWDFYSCEIVSHDIPTCMTAGETRTVHITFRNKGVLWTEDKQIRLGAIGDSDPFTGTVRQTISGEIGPNDTYTFTFNLTAPDTHGFYATGWRMAREGVTWFGPSIIRALHVTSPQRKG